MDRRDDFWTPGVSPESTFCAIMFGGAVLLVGFYALIRWALCSQ